MKYYCHLMREREVKAPSLDISAPATYGPEVTYFFGPKKVE